MKKLLLVLSLALAGLFAGSPAVADSPWPQCFPCPDDVR